MLVCLGCEAVDKKVTKLQRGGENAFFCDVSDARLSGL